MPEQRAVPIPDGPAPQGSGKRAAQWWETGEYAGPTQNCVFQYPEELGRAWAGWFGDLGVSPSTNQVYYVKVGFGISGNPCGGGAYVHAEIVPPANTELAISQTNPVRCFYDGLNTDYHEFNAAQGCPQQPGRGMYGGYSFDPKNQYSSWATATGTLYELYIPVKTTRPLNGIVPSSGPCNTCLYAGVWMIDGWNSPWVWPRIAVYVAGSASHQRPVRHLPRPLDLGPVSFDGAQQQVCRDHPRRTCSRRARGAGPVRGRLRQRATTASPAAPSQRPRREPGDQRAVVLRLPRQGVPLPPLLPPNGRATRSAAIDQSFTGAAGDPNRRGDV